MVNAVSTSIPNSALLDRFRHNLRREAPVPNFTP